MPVVGQRARLGVDPDSRPGTAQEAPPRQRETKGGSGLASRASAEELPEKGKGSAATAPADSDSSVARSEPVGGTLAVAKRASRMGCSCLSGSQSHGELVMRRETGDGGIDPRTHSFMASVAGDEQQKAASFANDGSGEAAESFQSSAASFEHRLVQMEQMQMEMLSMMRTSFREKPGGDGAAEGGTWDDGGASFNCAASANASRRIDRRRTSIPPGLGPDMSASDPGKQPAELGAVGRRNSTLHGRRDSALPPGIGGIGGVSGESLPTSGAAAAITGVRGDRAASVSEPRQADMRVERNLIGGGAAQQDATWALHESKWEDLGQLLEEDPFLDSLIERLRTQQISMAQGKRKAGRLGIGKNRGMKGSTILDALPVIDHTGTFRRVWDAFLTPVILILAVMVPLLLAFRDELLKEPWDAQWRVWAAIFIVFDVLLAFDVIICLRTNHTVDGLKVNDGAVIASKYIHGHLLSDFLGTLPLEILLFFPSDHPHLGHLGPLSLLRLLRLLKIFSLLNMTTFFRALERYTAFNPGVLRLAYLLLISLLVCHWSGCAWWYVGKPTVGVDSWSASHALMAEDVGHQYIYAFFWGVNIISGVTTMDVVPGTVPQIVLTTIVVLCSVMVMALLVSSATSTLSNMDATAEVQRRQLDTINQFMRYKSVPPELRRRINDFYEYLWGSVQSLKFADVVKELPPVLQLQLQLALNMRLLTQVPIFKFCDTRCIIAMTQKMVPVIFLPGEFILRQGADGRAMYFVNRGTCEVLKRHTTGVQQVQVATLSNSDFFGEGSLIFRRPVDASVRALTYCDMSVLDHDRFQEILTQFPELAKMVISVAKKLRERAKETNRRKSSSFSCRGSFSRTSFGSAARLFNRIDSSISMFEVNTKRRLSEASRSFNSGRRDTSARGFSLARGGSVCATRQSIGARSSIRRVQPCAMSHEDDGMGRRGSTAQQGRRDSRAGMPGAGARRQSGATLIGLPRFGRRESSTPEVPQQQQGLFARRNSAKPEDGAVMADAAAGRERRRSWKAGMPGFGKSSDKSGDKYEPEERADSPSPTPGAEGAADGEGSSGRREPEATVPKRKSVGRRGSVRTPEEEAAAKELREQQAKLDPLARCGMGTGVTTMPLFMASSDMELMEEVVADELERRERRRSGEVRTEDQMDEGEVAVLKEARRRSSGAADAVDDVQECSDEGDRRTSGDDDPSAEEGDTPMPTLDDLADETVAGYLDSAAMHGDQEHEHFGSIDEGAVAEQGDAVVPMRRSLRNSCGSSRGRDMKRPSIVVEGDEDEHPASTP